MLTNKEIHNRVKERLIPLILQYERRNGMVYVFKKDGLMLNLEGIQSITTTQHLDKPGGNGGILSVCNTIYKDMRGK